MPRWTDTVLRTLALLLATHASATPKQAKEPIFSILMTLKFLVNSLIRQ
jgi:hypothetical protein